MAESSADATHQAASNAHAYGSGAHGWSGRGLPREPTPQGATKDDNKKPPFPASGHTSRAGCESRSVTHSITKHTCVLEQTETLARLHAPRADQAHLAVEVLRALVPLGVAQVGPHPSTTPRRVPPQGLVATNWAARLSPLLFPPSLFEPSSLLTFAREDVLSRQLAGGGS